MDTASRANTEGHPETPSQIRADQPAGSGGRTAFRAWRYLKFVVAFGLLAFAVATHRDQIAQVMSQRHDSRLFALAFACYLSGVLLAFIRWHILVRCLGLSFRLVDAFRLGFIGLLFNLVIPGAIGGDLVKTAYLCREQGRRAGPIASVVIDRLAGVLGLFLLAALAGAIGWSRLDPPVRKLVTAAWIATGVVAMLLSAAFLPGLRRLIAPRREGLAAAGSVYQGRPWVVPLSVTMALATHLLNVIAFYAIARALFPVVPSLTEHLLIVPLTLFTTAAPLPFGAIGVTEAVSGQLFSMADSNIGAVTMMAFRLLQLGGALIGAAVYLANAGQVRELRAQAESPRIKSESGSRSDLEVIPGP